jgi:hypothetical protein
MTVTLGYDPKVHPPGTSEPCGLEGAAFLG